MAKMHNYGKNASKILAASDPRCDIAIWVMFLFCSFPPSFTTTEPRDPEKALTLIVKAVYSVDWGALVVAPEEEEVFWILDFVGEEETYRLQGLFASVHVVAQKQVVGLGRETAVFEQPQKVVELTVDVTCNKHRIK